MAGHRVIDDIAFAGISQQPTKPNFTAVPWNHSLPKKAPFPM